MMPEFDFELKRPLTVDDYVRLGGLLARYSLLNLEQIDGFCTALLCGPDFASPADCLRVIFNKENTQPDEATLNECFGLFFRHWNQIARLLTVDIKPGNEFFIPYLLEDDQGNVFGNHWAEGFLMGMDMHRKSWKPLLDDEENGGVLVPLFALACEHHPDPKMRPYAEPIDKDKRDMLIAGITAAAKLSHDYFLPQRLSQPVGGEGITYQRTEPKTGRNDPCPCGSGKKYKRCCAMATA